MMPRKPPSVPVALRLVCCLGLAGLLGWELADPPQVELLPAASELPENADAMPAVPGKDAIPAAEAAEIVARTIFRPSRRPPDKAPPAPPPVMVRPLPSLSGYTLVGTVLGPGGRRAVLKPAGNAHTILLGEGQSLDGWTVDHIGLGKVGFRAGSNEFSLTLPKPGQARR
jgi:hypothetical protein